MLRLKKIEKNYEVAGNEIKALKGINLEFRKSEFVAVDIFYELSFFTEEREAI